eukprot:3301583-Lingulodinium_polyedra.AAC.1
MAAQLVAAGPVTQARLASWGWVDTSQCQACHGAVGGAEHRFHLCPATQVWRRAVVAPTWTHQAEVACARAVSRGCTAWLWTRALARDPSADWAFAPAPERHE